MKMPVFSIILCFIFASSRGLTVYEVQDFGTLGTERSEARTLNQNGSVAGKCFDRDKCLDFFWSPDSGLTMITDKANRDLYIS